MVFAIWNKNVEISGEKRDKNKKNKHDYTKSSIYFFSC